MSRYRLEPTREQEVILLRHCGDARYVWNLAIGILRSGWGLLVRRLEDKAPGRVEKVPPAYTSQCCSACGHVAPENRESQAVFQCTACGYAANADVNAARNIAAGHAVKARGGDRVTGPLNREPQLALLAS
jgi:putative transposase